MDTPDAQKPVRDIVREQHIQPTKWGNTPDTEWEGEIEIIWDRTVAPNKQDVFDEIRRVISSRDTYWKERVQGLKRKLELERVEGECVECGGTGEGSDNPNSNSCEAYPCYLCRGKGRFSGYTKKTVDTLLDNLK